MLDPAALAKDVRSRLAPLEPLRRRVVRVYWMRGVLAAMLAAAAAGLGLLASLASAVWALQATGGRDGEIAVRIVPVLLAFVAPLVLIVPAAGVTLLAILRRYGRATVLEYDERFREEVIAPLVHEAVPDARLEPLGRVGDEQLRKSGLVPSGWEGTATGALLLHGGRPGAAFAVSTLDLRSRRRFGRAERVFRGLFASSERTASAPLADLERRLRAPLRVLAYDGGVAIALELPRAPFRASRVRPSDPAELARLVAFYAFVAESARSPATTSR
jgi:hypothetical protein